MPSVGVQKFIVLSGARTGSNYLMTMLGAHQSIRMYGELFNLDTLSKVNINSVLTDPAAYLNAILLKESTKKVAGFKLFYDHFRREYFTKLVSKDDSCEEVKRRFDDLENYLTTHFDRSAIYTTFDKAWAEIQADQSFKIIHLLRANKLLTFLAIKKAYLTNQWLSFKEVRDRSMRISLDYQECLAYFTRMEAYESGNRERFRSHDYMEVRYEDLESHKDRELKRIFEFLGVDFREVRSKLKKQNTTSLAESIMNYDALRKQFKSSPWEHFFEE